MMYLRAGHFIVWSLKKINERDRDGQKQMLSPCLHILFLLPQEFLSVLCDVGAALLHLRLFLMVTQILWFRRSPSGCVPEPKTHEEKILPCGSPKN